MLAYAYVKGKPAPPNDAGSAALPTAVAAWAPHPPSDAGVVTFTDPIVVFAEPDILSGSALFRKGVGLLAPLKPQPTL